MLLAGFSLQMTRRETMSPQDHNKTLSILYGLLGVLITAGLTIAAALGRNSGKELYFLPIPLLHFLTAYGLHRRRRWARITALILSALYVWIFPLGTLLAIYTWWLLHSEGNKQLYSTTTLPD